MPEDFDRELNPQITTLRIGVRSLKEVDVYPLSLGDELKFMKIIGETLQTYFKTEVDGDDPQKAAFVFIAQVVEENLPKIVELVMEDATLDDLTNDQAVELANIVIDTNFGSLAKNVESLSEKIKKTFLPERLSPSSVNNTEDTDLSISTEEVLETEESPEAK